MQNLSAPAPAAVEQPQENNYKALAFSIVLHVALLALLFFYRFGTSDPLVEAPPIVIEWGGGGDNAAAGLPDEGQGNNPAPQGQQLTDPTPAPPVETPTPTPPAPTPPAKSDPKPVTPAKVSVPTTTPTTEDPNVAAVRKQEAEARKKQQEEADRARREEATRQAAAEQERQRQAAEAERQRQEREAKKGKFGGAFGSGSGTGSGNTGKPGNQGIPSGTGSNPFGKSNGDGGGSGGGSGTGTGMSIGGGLEGRKVVRRGSIQDNSQKTGRVMVKVCVDGDGNVSSANATMAGSTTNDTELWRKAEQGARQFKFAPSGEATQCGTISVNFQVR